MERFIRLNLNEEGDRGPTANPLKPDAKILNETQKRLNRFANKYARKASKEFGRSGSGIFTK